MKAKKAAVAALINTNEFKNLSIIGWRPIHE